MVNSHTSFNMNEISSKTILLQVFVSIFAFIYLYSCKDTESHKKSNTKPHATSHTVQYQKPSSSFSDTLVIKSVSAVFYSPDSLQLNEIRAITEKRLYETEVHNCFYLMRNARMVLKKYWPHIHIIESSEYRYLLFIKADNSQTCIDLNTKEDMCGIFLFDRKKEPELIDMMNIDTDLGFYFKSG
jgi:hypothetical protein